MSREPTLAEVIRTAISSRLLDTHTALPGRVMSYAPLTQTAEIEILVQHATPNAEEDGAVVNETAPVLPYVPVSWPNGGGFFLHFPLAVGDEGMLIFSEWSMGQFRSTGDLAPPGDLRRHSMSSGVFVPMCLSERKRFPGPPPANGSALIATPGGGFLQVSAAGASGEFVALANLVQAALDTMQAAFNAHTHVVSTTGSAAAQAGTAAAVIPAEALGPLGPVAAATLKAE